MKKLIALFCLKIIINSSGATTYYFSSSGGDDSRTSSQAQNSSTPWKSIDKLNSFFSSLRPGDQVLFKKGDIFYGRIRVNKSGSSDVPIILSSYGSGAKPIITGFTEIVTWKNTGNNLWESSSSISDLSVCNIVVVNGINTPMGRTPNNTAMFNITAKVGNSIESPSLSGKTDYTGAEVVVRTTTAWVISRNKIINHSGHSLTFFPNFPNPANFTIYSPGNSFFIQNALSTLDQQNEWYYDGAKKQLSVYSAAKPSNLKMTSLNNLVDISASYITIDGLNFQGANSDVFQLNFASRVSIRNCDIQYCGEMGIRQGNNCTNLTVQACSFRDIENSGITDLHAAGNSNRTITGNSFTNISMVLGSMGSLDAQNMAIGLSDANATGDVIQNNSIDSCGYMGIFAMGQSFTVRNNFINHYCFYNSDGGGIYTGNRGTSRNITGNIVLNGMTSLAQGIYVDDNGSNVTISENTVSKANLGIYLHNAHDIKVQNNTIYNCGNASFAMGHDVNDPIRNVTISQNIFVLTGSTRQGNCSYQTSESSQTNFGSSDNNYICKPVGTDDNAWFTELRGSSFNHYTLAEWRSVSGFDKNSQKSPLTVSNIQDLRFEYNPTASSKTINLETSYIDLTGKTYAGSITLEPYSSAVLLRNSPSKKN